MSHPIALTEAIQIDIPFDLERSDPDARTVTGYCYVNARTKGDKWNLQRSAIERAGREWMKAPAIRAMHQPIAAGKATQLEWDDKGCKIVAYIGDDAEWRKCKDGIYRGFSVKGYPTVFRGADVEEFNWIETSLVDRPCDPDALFTVVRMDEGEATPVAQVLDEDEEIKRDEVKGDDLESDDVERAYDPNQPRDEADSDDASSDEANSDEADSASTWSVFGEEEVERYDPSQPRDDKGMWTIIGGHRVSISHQAVSHDHIHKAADRFKLSDSARASLIKAHDDGQIHHDGHLLRTIAHATTAAGATGAQVGHTHLAASSHINSALGVHGKDGSHENRWFGAQQVPQLAAGKAWAPPLGHHELQEGDHLHLPASEHHQGHGGRVTKVGKSFVDLEVEHAGITHGYRAKKSELKGVGYVVRDHKVHHLDEHKKLKAIAHAEGLENADMDDDDNQSIGFDDTTAQLMSERLFALVRSDGTSDEGEEFDASERHVAIDEIAGWLHRCLDAVSGETQDDNRPESEEDSPTVQRAENHSDGSRSDDASDDNGAEAIERLESERDTLQRELSTVRTSEESARQENSLTLSRLEAAEGAIERLESELESEREEISRLRELPITREAPVQFTGRAIEREFGINGVAQRAEHARAELRTALEDERAAILRSAEPDAGKRDANATRLMQIDRELARLR